MGHKPTVAVDLDGTLLRWEGGWKGLEHFGEPFEGAVKFTKRLGKFARVVIYTCRGNCSLDCQELDEVIGRRRGYYGRVTDEDRVTLRRQLIQEALDKHGFHYDEIYLGPGKVIASCYIDDRAVICRPAEHDNAYELALYFARQLCFDGKVTQPVEEDDDDERAA